MCLARVGAFGCRPGHGPTVAPAPAATHTVGSQGDIGYYRVGAAPVGELAHPLAVELARAARADPGQDLQGLLPIARGLHPASRASSSSTTAGSSLRKIGVGADSGTPGTIGVGSHRAAAAA